MSGDIHDLFLGLDRAGPGDAASLAFALEGLAPDAHILDAGCGTGADLAQLLAAVPKGAVTAIDLSERFIADIRHRLPAVRALVADMAQPPAGPYDLIWSAGAVYTIGVETALKAWRAHLAPGGRVAFSDIAWSGPARPEAAVSFWQAEGVRIDDAATLESRITASGWRILRARWLGQGGWAAYYEPLAARLQSAALDPTLKAGFEAEIALWRAHGASYDYRIFLAEPA
jgi:SAM-dependent methyltransferase